jgi:hypothetical protein
MDPDDDNDNGAEQTPDQDEGSPGDETDFPEVEENPDGSGGGDDPVEGDTAGDDQGDVNEGGNSGESTDAPPYDPDVILDDDGNIIQAGNNTSPLIVDIDGPDVGQTVSEGNPAVSGTTRVIPSTTGGHPEYNVGNRLANGLGIDVFR